MSRAETVETISTSMSRLITLLFCFSFLVGCASNPSRQFEQVRVGMEKNDVLALMDSPQRTQRWHGLDRWTYIYYDNDTRIEKEVHFADGKAKYVGEVFKPEISAEEQDARNEAANKEVEKVIQSRREESRKQYSDYEAYLKGQSGGNRYVPEYKPVQ